MTPADNVLTHLGKNGASFGHEIAAACDLTDDEYRTAIAQLVSAGLVTSDGFAGLRDLIKGTGRGRNNSAGRWSTLGPGDAATLPRLSAPHDPAREVRDAAVDHLAWTLLRRYGVMFRRLVTREAAAVPWRDLARVYRRLEARGEIRGGRFVSGMSGEQFALPDAVERLREIRRSGPDDRLIALSAADPLNLTGIITAGDRIRTNTGNRVVYRNGVPIAAMEGDFLRVLGHSTAEVAEQAAALAAGRRVPVVSGFVGRAGRV